MCTISFAGYVVAKLPFVPFSLLQKITHRGLPGDDPTDCSVVSCQEQYYGTYIGRIGKVDVGDCV